MRDSSRTKMCLDYGKNNCKYEKGMITVIVLIHELSELIFADVDYSSIINVVRIVPPFLAPTFLLTVYTARL